MENTKEINRYIMVIMIIALLLTCGSYLIFNVSKKMSNEMKVQEEVLISQNTQKQESQPIKLTEELKEELIKLIPRSPNCENKFKFEQFNKESYIEIETEIFENTECNNNYEIYNYDYKWDSTISNIYLYSYILLTDNNYYGSSYSDLFIPIEKIQKDENNNISKNSLIGYGGKYKFTFAKIEENYIYVSTNYVK